MLLLYVYQKLVNETFQSMWFMPVRDTKDAMASRLLQRVMNVTDVVAACRDTGFEWLEQLLDNVTIFCSYSLRLSDGGICVKHIILQELEQILKWSFSMILRSGFSTAN